MPPLAPSEILACVPPSLVTYLPMALATPVRAAPVDLLTRPKVNPVIPFKASELSFADEHLVTYFALMLLPDLLS